MDTDRADRDPHTPDVPLDLGRAADRLLEEAHAADAGRAAHNLLPGPGTALSQTLLALTAGAQLSDHVANGPATLQVLRGSVTVTSEEGDVAAADGGWTTIPRSKHGVTAHEDSVLLLTVAPVRDT